MYGYRPAEADKVYREARKQDLVEQADDCYGVSLSFQYDKELMMKKM